MAHSATHRETDLEARLRECLRASTSEHGRYQILQSSELKTVQRLAAEALSCERQQHGDEHRQLHVLALKLLRNLAVDSSCHQVIGGHDVLASACRVLVEDEADDDVSGVADDKPGRNHFRHAVWQFVCNITTSDPSLASSTAWDVGQAQLLDKALKAPSTFSYGSLLARNMLRCSERSTALLQDPVFCKALRTLLHTYEGHVEGSREDVDVSHCYYLVSDLARNNRFRLAYSVALMAEQQQQHSSAAETASSGDSSATQRSISDQARFDQSAHGHQAKVILVKTLESIVDEAQDVAELLDAVSLDTLAFLGERLVLLFELARDRSWWTNTAMKSHVLVLRTILSIACRATQFHHSEVQDAIGTDGVVAGSIQAMQTVKELRNQMKRDATSGGSSVLPIPDETWVGTLRDLVRLQANLCFRHRTHQDAMRKNEGIPHVLSACTLDEHNPYIREWAIVCIRNLCEGNMENQEAIRSIERRPQAVHNADELADRFDMQVKIDDDGRVHVVPVDRRRSDGPL